MNNSPHATILSHLEELSVCESEIADYIDRALDCYSAYPEKASALLSSLVDLRTEVEELEKVFLSHL